MKSSFLPESLKDLLARDHTPELDTGFLTPRLPVQPISVTLKVVGVFLHQQSSGPQLEIAKRGRAQSPEQVLTSLKFTCQLQAVSPMFWLTRQQLGFSQPPPCLGLISDPHNSGKWWLLFLTKNVTIEADEETPGPGWCFHAPWGCIAPHSSSFLAVLSLSIWDLGRCFAIIRMTQ